MYSVSADFLTAMAAPVQQHKVKGTIGSATFGPVNILAGSFSINNKICDSNEIGIGNVYIGELTATFRGVAISDGNWNGQVITPVFSLLVDEDTDTWEDVPLGVFTVAEATISASGVTVKAYDNMTKFDQYCTTYHGSGGGPQMAEGASIVQGRVPYPVVKNLCRKVGVPCGMTWASMAALPNGTNPLNLFEDNDITTYRDMLSWIAQTLGSNATINRNGELVLVPFKSASDYTFDDEHRHEGASFKDFTTRITQVWLDCKPVETSYEYHVSPNNGLSYELGQNPYLQIGSSADRDTAMGNILTSLQNVNYTPFDVNLTGCPIFDLGDVLTFTDGILSSSKKGAVTSFTYTANAAYKLSCGGKNPAEANAKSATDKRIDGVSSSVSSQKSNVTSIRNGEAATLGTGVVVDVIEYPYEVTDTQNHTNISAEVIMTTSAVETVVGDVFTLGDIVVKAIFYVDGIEIGDLYPEFIVDEGKDTINIDYSLHNLSVGAHKFKIALQLFDATGTISAQDIHEMLWGYGITFEVYLKRISVTTLPNMTAFYNDDNFSTDGMVVKGIFNNGKQTTITGLCTTEPADGDPLSLEDVGEHECVVSYAEDGNEFEDTFEYSIILPSLKNAIVTAIDQSAMLYELDRRKPKSVVQGLIIQNNAFYCGNCVGYLKNTGYGFALPDGTDTGVESFEGTQWGNVIALSDGLAYYDSTEKEIHKITGDADGVTSDDVIYSSANSLILNGDIDHRHMGQYIDVANGSSHRIIDTTDGSVVYSYTYTYPTIILSSVVAPDGTVYIILDSSPTFATSYTLKILKIEEGVATAYTVTVPGWQYINYNHSKAAYFRLRYDVANDCLVLMAVLENYEFDVGPSNTTCDKLTTTIYKLSKSDCSIVQTVNLPEYIDIPAGYLTPTSARIWLNVVGGTHYNVITNVDDVWQISPEPRHQWGAYYDQDENSAPESGYLFPVSHYASAYTYVYPKVYIDNLYMSAGSKSIFGQPTV